MLTRQSLVDDAAELVFVVKLAFAHAMNTPLPSCESSMLKSTLIKALTARAILYRLLAPDPEARRLAVEDAIETINVTNSISDAECTNVDVILGVSSATNLQRRSFLTHAHNRHAGL